MSELIDRDKFINDLVCTVSSPCETRREQSDAQNKQKYTVSEFIKELRRAPTISAVEVVHGEWIAHEAFGNPFYAYECSVCSAFAPVTKTYFCPNCGAKMDKESEAQHE